MLLVNEWELEGVDGRSQNPVSCPSQLLGESSSSLCLKCSPGVHWLDAGSLFPDQGLNVGHSGENPKSQPLHHQGTPHGYTTFCFSCHTSFFSLFRATPGAYGSSQARGQIGAAAEVYTTETATLYPNYICDLHSSLWQHQILNPLRPGIKPISSWILVRFLTCWATIGNHKPPQCFCKSRNVLKK